MLIIIKIYKLRPILDNIYFLWLLILKHQISWQHCIDFVNVEVAGSKTVLSINFLYSSTAVIAYWQIRGHFLYLQSWWEPEHVISVLNFWPFLKKSYLKKKCQTGYTNPRSKMRFFSHFLTNMSDLWYMVILWCKMIISVDLHIDTKYAHLR